MITTVTLNPALEKTYLVSELNSQGAHRIQDMLVLPSGKGVNVSRVLNTLGVPNVATGVVGGNTGGLICGELDKLGVKHDFVVAEAESRQCVVVLGQKKNGQVEFIESGPILSFISLDLLEEKLAWLAEASEWVVFSGNPPPNVPGDIYHRLIQLVKRRGSKTVLDAWGVWLQEGIRAGPDLIKPNWEEFQQLGGTPDTDKDALAEARKIIEDGVGMVLLSKGADGALVVTPDKALLVKIPRVKAVSPIGSGDSLVAGFLAGLVGGLSLSESLQFGSAVAISNACNLGAGIIDLRQVSNMKDKVDVVQYVEV